RVPEAVKIVGGSGGGWRAPGAAAFARGVRVTVGRNSLSAALSAAIEASVTGSPATVSAATVSLVGTAVGSIGCAGFTVTAGTTIAGSTRTGTVGATVACGLPRSPG